MQRDRIESAQPLAFFLSSFLKGVIFGRWQGAREAEAEFTCG